MIESRNAIEIKNLSHTYRGKKNTKQLDGFSYTFKKGSWVTILGPNGSGKSTLAKLIVGVLKTRSGTIKIDGRSAKSYKTKILARKIAYVPQETTFPHGINVYDFVSFGRNPYLNSLGILSKIDKKAIETALKKTGTYAWRNQFVDELSGGQKQKVIMAMVLAQDTELIIFDEPTTYLDIRNQYEFLEMIKGLHVRKKTIITILHNINQAMKYSDEVVILKEGKLFISGPPLEIITEKVLNKVYGINVKFHGEDKTKHIGEINLD